MEWQSFLIKDFGGIASSNRNPQINQAHEMVNFDTRDRYGDIITRKAHANLYSGIASADHRSKLSSVTYLKATSFIAETDDGTKQEVSVIISKGTIIEDSGAADRLNAFQVWTSHRWSGTAWVRKNWDGSTEGWFWLNHMILAKYTSSTLEYITTNITYSAALAAEVVGWSLYNVNRNEYVDIALATNDAGFLRLYVTNSYHSGSVNDILLLQRNYYPYDLIAGMGHPTTGIKSDEIQFHRVNNILKVGFGGKENRLALTIGYADRYFGLYDADDVYTQFSVAVMDNFNHRNQLYCEPIVNRSTDNFHALVTQRISPVSDLLPPGTYYIKAVGLLDGFQRVLLCTNTTVTINGNNIVAELYSTSGNLLTRLRKIEFYVSYDPDVTSKVEVNPYYLYTTMDYVASSKIRNIVLDQLGKYILRVSTADNYTDSSPLLLGSDTNTVTNITATVSSAVLASSPGNGSNYKLHIPWTDGLDSSVFTVDISQSSTLLAANRRYNISFDLNVPYSDANNVNVEIIGHPKVFSFTFSGGTSQFCRVYFENVQMAADTNTLQLQFYVTEGEDIPIYIDNLSIVESSEQEFKNSTKVAAESKGIEITNNMGYEPTTDLALSWDKAIVAGGRAYLANPVFKDGRQNNRVFFSVFSGVGASQYDIIPFNFLNSFDLELFDGNNLVSLELLPNGNFLALRKNSAQIIDSSTGASRQILYGKGCVSIDSVINSGTEVIWASQGDIILTDGLNDANITENTIRNDYREIQNTANIFATREIKDNAYRFYSTDADGEPQEYLISKRGWLKFTRFTKTDPIAISGYHTASDGTIIMLTTYGTLLKDQNSAVDSENIEFNWLSVPFDLTLMGSASQGNMYVKAIAVKCTAARNMSLVAKIYVNGTLYDTQTIALVSTSGDHTKIVRIKLGCSARTIQLGLSGTDGYGNSLIISAVGIQYKVIRGDQLG